MTRKFWNWVRNKEPDSFGSDRTLYLDGTDGHGSAKSTPTISA